MKEFASSENSHRLGAAVRVAIYARVLVKGGPLDTLHTPPQNLPLTFRSTLRESAHVDPHLAENRRRGAWCIVTSSCRYSLQLGKDNWHFARATVTRSRVLRIARVSSGIMRLLISGILLNDNLV